MKTYSKKVNSVSSVIANLMKDGVGFLCESSWGPTCTSHSSCCTGNTHTITVALEDRNKLNAAIHSANIVPSCKKQPEQLRKTTFGKLRSSVTSGSGLLVDFGANPLVADFGANPLVADFVLEDGR